MGLAGRTHTNKRELGFVDGGGDIRGGAQAPIRDSSGDDLADFGLDNRSLPFIDEVDLHRKGIHADYRMSILGKTPGRNRTHVAQTENANVHNDFLSADYD